MFKWIVLAAVLTLTACSAHIPTELEYKGHLASMQAKEACYKSQDVGNDPLALAIKELGHAAHGDPCATSDLFTAQENEVTQKNSLAGKAIDGTVGLVSSSVTPAALAYTAGKYFDSVSDRDELDELREENEELEEELEELEEDEEGMEFEPFPTGDCYPVEGGWNCPPGVEPPE